jgi:hypothetical protein
MTSKSEPVYAKHEHESSTPQDEWRRLPANDVDETLEPASLSRTDRLLHLQSTIGNQAVQRTLARERSLSIQRQDERHPWDFDLMPPALTYNPAGPFSAQLSPGGLDLGYGQLHLSGGGSPADGSWNTSLYYGSPLLPFPGDVTRGVNAGYSGLMSGQLGPALTAAGTLGSLGFSPAMPFGAGATLSSTPDDPFKLMFGIQGSF